MRRDKTTFILSTEYEKFTEDMTDEQAGKLFKAILCYESGGEVEELPAEIRLAWSFIRKRLDENKAAYAEACESHRQARENGHKKNKEEQKVQKVTKCTKGNKELQTAIDNDNENDNENDKDSNITPKPPTEAEAVSSSDLSEPLKAKIMEWLAYKRERREAYKPTGLKSLLTEVKRHETESGTDAVINLVGECMANGWRGIIWERLTRPPVTRSGTNPKIHSMPERAYDFEALERQLIKNG